MLRGETHAAQGGRDADVIAQAKNRLAEEIGWRDGGRV